MEQVYNLLFWAIWQLVFQCKTIWHYHFHVPLAASVGARGKKKKSMCLCLKKNYYYGHMAFMFVPVCHWAVLEHFWCLMEHISCELANPPTCVVIPKVPPAQRVSGELSPLGEREEWVLPHPQAPPSPPHPPSRHFLHDHLILLLWLHLPSSALWSTNQMCQFN